MFANLIFLFSGVLLALGSPIDIKSHGSGRIVGGFEVDITQVPWQAAIQTLGIQFCGALIISEKWLLTAAHCTQRYKAEDLLVRIGTTEKSIGGAIHKVKRIVQNNQFDIVNIDYDFSLLELEDSIEFNEKTQPIKLVDRDQVLVDETLCLVTGWGNTLSLTEPDGKLRGVEVPIVNQEDCIASYGGVITERMLCAGLEKGGKDACQNDSGGPMVVFDDENKNAVLVGVTSWGAGCAEPNKPGIYARVTEARDWIYENTGI